MSSRRRVSPLAGPENGRHVQLSHRISSQTGDILTFYERPPPRGKWNEAPRLEGNSVAPTAAADKFRLLCLSVAVEHRAVAQPAGARSVSLEGLRFGNNNKNTQPRVPQCLLR